MSTSTQTPTTNDLANKANAAATQAVEGAAYTATRAQQEAHGLQAQGQHHKGRTEEALNKLESDLEKTTESAVEEGKEDVEQATATYFQKALNLADYGFSTAESYINMGKEKLAGPPGAHDKPATGFTATLASTGLAALDATHRGITMAHQTLHDRSGQFPHAHNANEPAHPVTVPSKPVGEAVKDNVAAAQSTAQPHIDSAKATAQPHIDAAKPYVASAQEAAKPYVDAGAAQVNTAATGLKQQVDAASTVVQGKVDEMKASDKPVSTQLSEAASNAATSAQQSLSNAATQAQGVLNSNTGKTQKSVGNTLAPAPTSAQPKIDPAAASAPNPGLVTDTTTELPKVDSAAASAPVPEVAKEGDTKTL